MNVFVPFGSRHEPWNLEDCPTVAATHGIHGGPTGGPHPRYSPDLIEDLGLHTEPFGSPEHLPLRRDFHGEDGEIIPTALGSMQALLTPGHSSGQLCFYFAERKLLLAGDHLSRPGADGRALADFRASLRQLQVLNVDCVLPSHGRPCSASEYRIASFLDCRREMASRVGCLRARGNESARELVARTSCVGLARRLSACATD